MSSHFTAGVPGNSIALTLHRYPHTSDPNLQAWDAADEHLLKHLLATDTAPKTHFLVINDGFGALTCALRALYPAASIHFAADGRTAHLGCIDNLIANGLSPEAISFSDCTRLPALAKDTRVLMKLPKSLNFLADTLSQLSQLLTAGHEVLIGAKAKNINQALLSLIGKQLGSASASLAWKKTRVITAIADGTPRPLTQPLCWPLPEFNLSISNLSNVFAASKLDVGARLMLANLPSGNFEQVIDLGCGNGVLGLAAASRYKDAHCYFADESAMAVASAAENWRLNGFDAQRATFVWDDCLTHLPMDVSPDLILCNPPFHQGEAITDHIAWQMFNDAKRALRPGGVLHVVGNRHLGYHIKLQRLFGNCKTIASNGKFVILQASKS